MVNIYSEKSIGTAVIKEINKEKKWGLICRKGRCGVDIELKNKRWGKRWFIEVKREPNTKNKKSSIYGCVATAIGQLSYRMKHPKSSYYGIAVPNTKMYKQELSKIPIWIKKRLKINIFLVPKHGKITIITPSKKVHIT